MIVPVLNYQNSSEQPILSKMFVYRIVCLGDSFYIPVILGPNKTFQFNKSMIKRFAPYIVYIWVWVLSNTTADALSLVGLLKKYRNDVFQILQSCCISKRLELVKL